MPDLMIGGLLDIMCCGLCTGGEDNIIVYYRSNLAQALDASLSFVFALS